jgi:hypothetical protein
MSGQSIRKFAPYWLVVIASLAAVSMAGGFYLEVTAPEQGTDEGVVLLARPYGCHKPSDAEMTATAEGIVGGKRQTIKLDLTLRSTGVYAIRQQWPDEGSWVIAITGKYLGATRTALVTLAPGGKVPARKDLQVRMFQRSLNAQEINAAIDSAKLQAKS